MKRFTHIELAGVLLGAILFVGGSISVIWPHPGVVSHFTNDVLGMSPRNEMEVVSVSGARLYGVLGMLLGSAIAALAVYRSKA
jgi:hypothetical protein